MSFSITEFRSKGLSSAGARPNLFSAQITSAPSGVSANIKDKAFTFLCKIASIPPSTVGVVEVPYFGRMVKVPGNRTFDNLSVTVINDEDFLLRNATENWMNQMNSHESNTSLTAGSSSDLFGTLAITHYGRNQSEIGSGAWTFKNIFPVALGEIALDWGSNDTIEEFTIDFAYDWWEHSASTS